MNLTKLPHDVRGGSAPKILIAIYNYFFFRFVLLCVGGKASKIFNKSSIL